MESSANRQPQLPGSTPEKAGKLHSAINVAALIGYVFHSYVINMGGISIEQWSLL